MENSEKYGIKNIHIDSVNNDDEIKIAPEENQEKQEDEETITLDIGDISEIADGRGEKPGTKVTGNRLIDSYNRINNYFLQFTRIKEEEKMAFYQMLSTMIGAGVSLVKALDILSQQMQNQRLKKIIWEIANEIERGSTFSKAAALYSGVFSEAEVGMIAAGEASGRLFDILTNLATQSEKTAGLYSKFRSAMIYPIFVIIFIIGAISSILLFVIPKLTNLFTQTGKELPSSTKMMLGASDFLRTNILAIIFVLAVSTLFFIAWKRTEKGRYKWDSFKLKIPVFGGLFRKMSLARFSRSLSALVLSGVPIIRALEINARAVGNEVYRKKLIAASEDVGRGIPLGENLSANGKVFPPMVVYMISVGEKIAQVGEMSGKIAQFYEQEIDNTVNGLMKLLQPILIAILGSIVIIVVYSIMQPIMQISDLAMEMN